MKNMTSLLTALALTLSLTDAGAITFTTNTAIGIGNTTYDGQDITVSGCTLTVDGPHAFASLAVTNGGVVTHSPAPNGEANNRLDLTIADALVVETGCAINATGKGYAGGKGPGTVGQQIYQGPGAGHGGHGGLSSGGYAGGAAYGSAIEPATFGSGGGPSSGTPGGAGGGMIRLVVAGTLTLDGQLLAEGGPGNTGWYGGPGSGGSIWVTACSLAGGGSISVNGGVGFGTSNRAGGGGGGRLALYFGAIPFTGAVTAWGGTGYQRGGAGTIYRKPSGEALGELLIDNGDVSGAVTPLACEAPFHLIIANHALVYPTTALTFGNLQIQDRGTLFQMSGGVALDMVCYGDAHVAPTGTILADRTGYGAQSGPGAGYSWSASASGAGHGGIGGQGEDWPPGRPGGPTYGSATKPITAGSGGGNLDVGLGGQGGGAIRFTVGGQLNMDGLISANGGDSQLNSAYRGGGGAGGSIWITAGTITGAGMIAAKGGNASYWGYANRSGGGGGGRIAIYANSIAETITGNLTVNGGSSLRNWGANGTIHTSTTMLPPEVASLAPEGTVTRPVASVEVGFDQAVLTSSFTASDVVIDTPGGTIPTEQLTLTTLRGAGFRVSFPEQTAAGAYQIQIGPHIENLYGDEMAVAYTGGFTIANPIISGFIKQGDGTPMANVSVGADGGISTMTGTDGGYALAVPPGWSGSVTPQAAGWVFTPASRTYVNLSADVTAGNFSMTLAEAAVLSLTRSGTTLQFAWPSAVGLRYQLQSSPNLLPDSWTNEGEPAAGTGSPLDASLLIGPEPAKFFRLKIN